MRLLRWRGFDIGFTWTYDGTGFSSKRSAAIAGYHPRDSITWRWALYWQRPTLRTLFKLSKNLHRLGSAHKSYNVTLPVVGGFSLALQETMPLGDLKPPTWSAEIREAAILEATRLDDVVGAHFPFCRAYLREKCDCGMGQLRDSRSRLRREEANTQAVILAQWETAYEQLARQVDALDKLDEGKLD